jgi:hypothetical protein
MEVKVPDIGRNRISDLELDDVTDCDFSRRNIDGGAFSNTVGGGRRKRTQRVHGLLSLILLQKADNNVQDDDGGHNATLDPGLDAKGDGHGEDKHQHHGVGDLPDQDFDGLDTRSIVQLVRALLAVSAGGIGLGQAIIDIALELSHDIVDVETVGRLCELLIALAGDVVLHAASSSPSDVTQRARNAQVDRRKGLSGLEKMSSRGLKKEGRMNVGLADTSRYLFLDTKPASEA